MDTNNWRPPQVGEPAMDAGDWRSQLQLDSRQRIVNKIMDVLKRYLPFSGEEGLQVLKEIALRFEEKIYTAATSQSDYLRKISLKIVTLVTPSQNTTMANYLQSNFSGNNNRPPDPVLMDTNGDRPVQGGELSTVSFDGVFGMSVLMDTNGERPAQGGEPSMDTVDWRSQLQPDSRHRILNKIMETLKRHFPSHSNGLLMPECIAAMFENKIYASASSQSDYLRKISLEMLTLETMCQTAPAAHPT